MTRPAAVALLLAAVAVLVAPAGAAAADRVLLVAVGEYACGADLAGPPNDLQAFRAVLLGAGVEPEAIRTLVDRQATAAAILEVVDSWLVQGVGPEDRIVLFFAGHGVQLPLLAEADRESDAYDEALAAWDYDERTGEGTIRDDALDALLSRSPAGEQLVVVDACHSGSADRYGSRARALPAPRDLFVVAGQQPPPERSADCPEEVPRPSRVGSRRLLFAAARSCERAYERDLPFGAGERAHGLFTCPETGPCQPLFDTLPVTLGLLDWATASVCDANRPPLLPELEILPLPWPVGGPGLTCSWPDAADPDGDPVTLEYTWLLDEAVQAGETDVVFGSAAAKGQTVRCEVVASDGVASTPAASSGASAALGWGVSFEGSPVTSEDPYTWIAIDDTSPAEELDPLPGGAWSLELLVSLENPADGDQQLAGRVDDLGGLAWGLGFQDNGELTWTQPSNDPAGCATSGAVWDELVFAGDLALVTAVFRDDGAAPELEVQVHAAPEQDMPLSEWWPPSGAVAGFTCYPQAVPGADGLLLLGGLVDSATLDGRIDFARISDVDRLVEPPVLETLHGLDAGTVLYLPLEDGTGSLSGLDARVWTTSGPMVDLGASGDADDPWVCLLSSGCN